MRKFLVLLAVCTHTHTSTLICMFHCGKPVKVHFIVNVNAHIRVCVFSAPADVLSVIGRVPVLTALLLWNRYKSSARRSSTVSARKKKKKKVKQLPVSECECVRAKSNWRKPQWKLSSHIYSSTCQCNEGKYHTITDFKCHCCYSVISKCTASQRGDIGRCVTLLLFWLILRVFFFSREKSYC